jgi:hypothetical protein
MDAWFEDFEEAPATSGRPDRELVPEGDHEFLIKAFIPGQDRDEIRLAHEDGRYEWVFCKLPKDPGWAKRIAKSLRVSLGMSPEQWASAEPSDVADRLVRARVYHKVGKTGGRTFVNVGEFLPAEKKPEPVKKPARRTAGQKAIDVAMEAAPDDIPF